MVRAANRTWEIRPSGMKEGAYGNVGYGGIRNPLHNRKGACWKLSACGCARRISILTRALCDRYPSFEDRADSLPVAEAMLSSLSEELPALYAWGFARPRPDGNASPFPGHSFLIVCLTVVFELKMRYSGP